MNGDVGRCFPLNRQRKVIISRRPPFFSSAPHAEFCDRASPPLNRFLVSLMSPSAAGERNPASQPLAPKLAAPPSPAPAARAKPKYPGIRVTCNGNFLVTQYVETRVTEGGVFYPITPSTEGGEIYQQSF